MKANVLLIANKSSEWNRVIRAAVERTGRTMQLFEDSKRAFNLLRSGCADVDLVIVDLDPGIHSMAVLEALDGCDNPPPIIVVTGFEEGAMTPIAFRHGAAACIAKPFTLDELVYLMQKVAFAMAEPNCFSCDLWGHPHRERLHVARRCAR